MRAAEWLRHHATEVVLLATILVGGYLIDHNRSVNDHKFYRAALASCERGNVVRTNLNLQTSILRQFLDTAAETRETSAMLAAGQDRPAEALVDRRAARAYRDQARSLVPLRNPVCLQVVEQP